MSGCLGFLISMLVVGSLAMRDVTYPEMRGRENPLASLVVLVVIDSLSIGDINHEMMPNLTGLAEMGAIGLMNGRTPKPNSLSMRTSQLGQDTAQARWKQAMP